MSTELEALRSDHTDVLAQTETLKEREKELLDKLSVLEKGGVKFE